MPHGLSGDDGDVPESLGVREGAARGPVHRGRAGDEVQEAIRGAAVERAAA